MRRRTKKSFCEGTSRFAHRVFIILFLLVCSSSCDTFNNEESLKKQAKAYIDTVLPQIITSWDSKELLRNAHPELAKKNSAEQLDLLFFTYMNLGSLKNYDESQGKVSIARWTVNGQTNLLCDYVTRLDFEKGSARIWVEVVKDYGQWSILSFIVDSDLLKNVAQKPATRDEAQASDEPLPKEKLEEIVQKLPAGDIIAVRRVVEKVFALAEIYEKEGRGDDAIVLYERALEVDAANLPYQFRLARLLIAHERKDEGISRLRNVDQFAEDEGLIQQTRDLLGSTGEKIDEQPAQQKPLNDIEIVLVPLGNPSATILAELRAALQERLGITVSISDRPVDMGEPDRKRIDLYISPFFTSVQQRLSTLQRDQVMREFRLTDEDLKSPHYQAHFIRGVLTKSGEQGKLALQQFESELKKSSATGQYDIYRLAGEMRRAFPVDARENVVAYLGITPADVYTPGSRGMYAGADGIYGVLSYYSFTDWGGEDRQCRPRLLARALKQAISTVNLTLGIPRCHNPYCPRSFPFSMPQQDAKSDRLCPDCLKRWQEFIQSPHSNAMANELLDRGVFYDMTEKNPDKAIELYQKALRIKPDFSLAYQNIGIEYEKKGMRDLSIENFRNALDISPDLEKANLFIGLDYNRSKEPQKAIEHMLKSLAKNPENASTREGLGRAYYELKDWDKAAEHLEAAARLNPKSPELPFLVGVSYDRLDKPKEAANAFSKAIEIDPNMPTAHYDLALVLRKIAKKDQAIEEFKKEIEINPSYAKAYRELGIMYSDNKMWDDAISIFKAAISVKPDEAASWVNLGYAYYLMQNYPEAVIQYEKALELDPSNVMAHYNKALAHFARSQMDEAVMEYDKAAALGYSGSQKFRDSLRVFRK